MLRPIVSHIRHNIIRSQARRITCGSTAGKLKLLTVSCSRSSLDKAYNATCTPTQTNRNIFHWIFSNPIVKFAKNETQLIDFTNVSPTHLTHAATQIQSDYDQRLNNLPLSSQDLQSMSTTDLLKLLTELDAQHSMLQNVAVLLLQMNIYDNAWIRAVSKASNINRSHRNNLDILEALQFHEKKNNGTFNEIQHIKRLMKIYQRHSVLEREATLLDAEQKLLHGMTKSDVGTETSSSKNIKAQLEIVYSYVTIKKQQAELLGYESYLHQAMENRMLPRGDVESMQNELAEKALVAYETLTPPPSTVKVDISDYISLDGTLQGVFGLCRALFGIFIAEDPNPRGWNMDVRLFHMTSESNEPLGSFYFDPFQRTTKPLFTFMGPIKSDVVYVTTTVQAPVWNDSPTPMELDDVVAIFHEFGHILQYLMADNENRNSIGETLSIKDIWEVVPMFMEHWAFNETILQTISQISSGNTIPDETLLQIKDHRRRTKIEETMRRAFMGQLEFELFSPMDETVVSLQRRLSQRFTPHELLPKSDLTPILQLIEANRSNPVSQYRYLVSEVISADIFQGFQEAGMSNQDEMRNLGLLFYEHLLKPGPLVDGKKAIKLLRGRDHVTTTAYCSMYGI